MGVAYSRLGFTVALLTVPGCTCGAKGGDGAGSSLVYAKGDAGFMAGSGAWAGSAMAGSAMAGSAMADGGAGSDWSQYLEPRSVGLQDPTPLLSFSPTIPKRPDNAFCFSPRGILEEIVKRYADCGAAISRGRLGDVVIGSCNLGKFGELGCDNRYNFFIWAQVDDNVPPQVDGTGRITEAAYELLSLAYVSQLACNSQSHDGTVFSPRIPTDVLSRLHATGSRIDKITKPCRAGSADDGSANDAIGGQIQ